MTFFSIEMKWKKTLILLLALMLIIGCSIQTASSKGKQERNEASLHYEIIKPPYHSFLEEVINANKLQAGSRIIQKENATYVIITLGQRPSGGYNIAVQSIEQSGDKVIVTYTEKKPAGMAISMITYPAVVVKLPKTEVPVVVQQKK